MGGVFSKHTSSHRPVHHVTELAELMPYGGTPIEYKTVTINTDLDVQSHFSFMACNVTIQATNEEQYHPELAVVQGQGYKMLTFASSPGSIQKYGFSNAKSRKFTSTTFYGIFRKLFPDELLVDKMWELKVLKSTLVNVMFTDWADDVLMNIDPEIDDKVIDMEKFHILQTLKSISEEGGRLLSVELTGMSEEQIDQQKQYIERRAKTPHQTTEPLPEMQVAVDVFFEIPVQPSNERFVYKIVKCQLESIYKHAFPHGHFVTVYNPENVMSNYFGTGWRLADIMEDYSVSHLSKMDGFRPHETHRNNCLWLFEKPVSRLDDNVQCYEGTMVEYWVPAHNHGRQKDVAKESVLQDNEWEPVIRRYGEKGWQIVKIFETPDKRFEGSFKQSVYTKYYLFFQRIYC